MAINQLIPSFNAGELSPYMNARSDIEKYASGCQFLENFIIMTYGGAYRRPGTEFLGVSKYPDKQVRLLGFNYSTTTRFVLEIGEQYVRFWSNGIQVMVAGVPLEVASPYYESEIRELQFVQINDVMYFVHPLHAPRKLTRLADDNWTFADVAWDWPALLDENVDAKTIAPSATSGTGITLTASADLFEAGHVGSYWQLAHVRDNASVEKPLTSNGSSANLTVLGDWELTSNGTWSATVQVERSYDNATSWEVIRSYKGAGDRNISSTGREEKECLLRITVTGWASGSGRAWLELAEAKDYGIVKITDVTDATHATADVVNSLFATTATKYWSEGAWSTKRGFPRAVALHEDRIFYGGTASRPLSIWGTIINDYQNLRVSSNDDAGLFFSLSAQEANPIQWMLSQDSLLIGTAGEEWTLSSSDSDSAITPTNVKAKRQSSFGSKHIRALIVNDVVLFTQRQGRKVRELVYSFEKSGWVAVDLTILSEHVTKGQILECAFQQQPDAIYWTITGEGQLVGMTYERQQNVVGWHRHTTQGTFESVATIYGASGPDEVWVSVKRVINGVTKRYIERLRTDSRETLEAEDKANWWYLDCAKRVTLPAESATITGLAHLEGLEVDILADGAVSPSRTVTGGQITLQAPAKTVLVGLRFDSRLQNMNQETQAQDGTTKGKTKRTHSVVISLYKSLGGQYSSVGGTWYDLYSRDMKDKMDASPPPFTGDKAVTVASSYEKVAWVSIRQIQPLPLTILAIVPKWDAYGN